MKLSIALLYNLAPTWDAADVRPVVEGIELLKNTLEDLGHRVTPIQTGDGVEALVDQLQSLKPDIVFNQCEGYHDRSTGEYCVAALLELLGLPYTGSGPVALALALDKPLAKQLFRANDIATPPFAVFRPGTASPLTLPAALKFPVILKLASEDASLGLTNENLVHDEASLAARVESMLGEHETAVMAEEFIDGREFTVALLDAKPIALEEIEFAVEPRILSYRAKWTEGSEEHEGADSVFDPTVGRAARRQMFDLARRVQAVIGMRDYSRVDFRMDGSGRVYVLEANPNPDITSTYGYRQSLAAANISYPEFLTRLLTRARKRGSAAKRNFP